MAGVSSLIEDGLIPAGCYRNREHYARFVSGIVGDPLLPLFDPQTSGGLLIALPPAGAREFLARSESSGAFAECIGSVQPTGGTPLVFV